MSSRSIRIQECHFRPKTTQARQEEQDRPGGPTYVVEVLLQRGPLSLCVDQLVKRLESPP